MLTFITAMLKLVLPLPISKEVIIYKNKKISNNLK